jgi:excisionase family DNA binding protein
MARDQECGDHRNGWTTADDAQVAGECAHVHPRTLRRWIAAGRVPAYRLGPRLIKVDLDELDEFMRPVTCAQRHRRSS